MLTIYRSNRAEWLANLLAEQLRLSPPKPFEKIDVVVNTWPTSRWLGEQLAITTGINALVRFPFPGTHLRRIVQLILEQEENGEDPWKASQLIWTIIEKLPEILEKDEAKPLKDWLDRNPKESDLLTRDEWQLAKSIANAFDAYALYRPEQVAEWCSGINYKSKLRKLPPQIRWQPIFMQLLKKHLCCEPFGLQTKNAIEKLKDNKSPIKNLPAKLYIFGVSHLAPVQIELIQALSGSIEVEIFLLTPCKDLWQRCKSKRESNVKNWRIPAKGKWLLQAPRLEATLGRMGAEFQQLLEGSGEYQLGESTEQDLFAQAANMAKNKGKKPTLLEQLQQKLITEEESIQLTRDEADDSLIFVECPGRRRQVQLIRDQIIQWLAKDKTLEPRDILIMTPQVKSVTPLIASVFNDVSAVGVEIPWRITDRSQQESPGLIQAVLTLFEIAGKRLTATSLYSLLINPAIQKQQGLLQTDIDNITKWLQSTGFHWGLDGIERGGDETHSLCWCLDRWLLGLVFPTTPGLALKGIAPFSNGLSPSEINKYWDLLSKLCNYIREIRKPRPCKDWINFLQILIEELFKDGGGWQWERKHFLEALEKWAQTAEGYQFNLESAFVADILNEELSIESGRFGHRSGNLTISALEPMRAIPHRVIVLMGIDGNIFPGHQKRPSFHLLEQSYFLGDSRKSDKDRYALLETLMSCRQHLMITWNCRDEKTGEVLEASNPIQQWLGFLENELEGQTLQGLLRKPPLNPLDRKNFLPENNQPPNSCDRRNLEARIWLDKAITPSPLGLALPITWSQPNSSLINNISEQLLIDWLTNPQQVWLNQLQLNPKEWDNKIQDLDPLSFNEFDRYNLIKEHYQDLIDSLNLDLEIKLDDKSEVDWAELYLGQAKLPPKAARFNEVDLLNSRWTSLLSTISRLGPVSKQLIQNRHTNSEVLFAGNILLIIEIGLLKPKSVMEGWLSHLKACSCDNPPNQTVVISRSSHKAKRNSYEISLRWKSIPRDLARLYLEDLELIATQGLTQCWPIPPQSGWALAKARHFSPEKGNEVFQKNWDGTFNQVGECEKEEMQLCFGSQCDSNKILNSAGFEEAFCSLYKPLTQILLK